MITLDELALFLQSGLNTNTEGIVFDITSNHKQFQKRVFNKKRYEYAKAVVYGVLRNIMSEAVPVKDLGHYTVTTELELAVTTDSLIEENLANVFEILQKYYEANIGSDSDVNGSRISINIVVPNTGLEKLDQLGGTIPLTMTCVFTVTKNAYTFNDVKWYIDSDEIKQITSWNMNNIKKQEIVNSANSTINKNIFKSQGLSVSFTAPHSSLSWFQDIFDDYYKDRTLNKVYTLKMVDPSHTGGISWKMGIYELPISGSPAMANGVGIVFAEMRDDLV